MRSSRRKRKPSVQFQTRAAFNLATLFLNAPRIAKTFFEAFFFTSLSLCPSRPGVFSFNAGAAVKAPFSVDGILAAGHYRTFPPEAAKAAATSSGRPGFVFTTSLSRREGLKENALAKLEEAGRAGLANDHTRGATRPSTAAKRRRGARGWRGKIKKPNREGHQQGP